MADMLQYAARDTAWVHLKDAAGNPMFKDDDETKPRRVNLYGPGTRQHAQAAARKQSSSLSRLREQREVGPDEVLQEDAEFLAAVTHSFENVDIGELSGRELALALYRERKLGFIVEQLGKFQADWKHFTPGSATS
jgi:hypothetical protein